MLREDRNMKKLLLCAFIVFTGFTTVFSQSNTASFFIIPVTGMGASPEDNGFFYRQIQFEAELQRYVIVNNQQTANYLLQGKLALDNSISGDSSINGKNANDYLFSLALINNSSNEIIAEQVLIYQSTHDVGPFIPIIIYNLLSGVPLIQITQNTQNTQETGDAEETQDTQETPIAQETQQTDRRYNRLYVGADVLWTPKIYQNLKPPFNALNFGFGLSAEWQFSHFLSIGTGALLTADWYNTERSSTGKVYSPDIGLEIPLTLRFIIKPRVDNWIVPFAGAHYNYSFAKIKTVKIYPFSWMAGLQFGIDKGPGILTFTPSFSMDIGTNPRMLIYVGIGYKFGFLKK
jgi:hypothetical protein